jgi:hypothetical protein
MQMLPETALVVVPQEDEVAQAIVKAGLVPLRQSLGSDGGDAAFWGTVDGKRAPIGVERKRADNLVDSWMSGELADQLRRMLDAYTLVILLVEGDVRPSNGMLAASAGDGRDKVYTQSYDALMNDLQTWQDVGVRIQWAPLHGSGKRIASLYEYYQKDGHRATERGRIKKSKDALLLTTPGLGPIRAERLLRALCGLPGASEVVAKELAGKTGTRFRERLDGQTAKHPAGNASSVERRPRRNAKPQKPRARRRPARLP